MFISLQNFQCTYFSYRYDTNNCRYYSPRQSLTKNLIFYFSLKGIVKQSCEIGLIKIGNLAGENY